MVDRSNSTTPMNWVAIDIAKEWNTVLVESHDGKCRSFKMANRISDHDRFMEFLRRATRTHPLAVISS